MDSNTIRAGIGAGVVALITGAVLGTYGGWAPVFSLAATDFGFWVVALALSTVLAFVYSYWFDAFLPGSAIVRGAIFGVLVWILMLILGGVSDFFKEATYPDPAGAVVFLTLVLHGIWGAVLGTLLRAR